MSKMNRKLIEQRRRDDWQGDSRHEDKGHRDAVPVDALVYARLLAARRVPGAECTVSTPAEERIAPTIAQRRLMSSLAIDFDAGGYRFDDVRYECLSDAVDQAIAPAWRDAPGGP